MGLLENIMFQKEISPVTTMFSQQYSMHTLYPTIPSFSDAEKEGFRKYCGKRRESSFSHISKNINHRNDNFELIFLSYANVLDFVFDSSQSKILSFCTKLIQTFLMSGGNETSEILCTKG